MQSQHLTPEILCAAADRLTSGGNDLGHWFMCDAVESVAGAAARDAFADLLVEHEVTRHLGGAMVPLYDSGNFAFCPERQAVRFMFLEFLALSLES